MEEQNTFLDYNPQYSTPYVDENGLNKTNYAMAGDESNAIDRWWNPQIAENEAFARENYFVDKQNAFTEYMYNKANEYNSPTAQMQRAKEAGINLNLAAGGIMGQSNATATPQQGAKGNTTMQANGNPISEIMSVTNGIKNLTDTANGLDKIFNFGKTERALTKQLNATADQAAEQANFTYWQKRQFRRTMHVMTEQAYKNLEQTEQNILNLQRLYEVYQQQKWNIAEDTTLKEAQTGETIERTKTQVYKNWEEQFKKAFRDTFGIQLNESDLAMLVQATLNGKGNIIIDSLVEGFKTVIKEIGKQFKQNFKVPTILPKSTPIHINGTDAKIKEVSMKRWENDAKKQIKYKWEHKKSVRNFYKDKGGYEAYEKKQLEIMKMEAGF